MQEGSAGGTINDTGVYTAPAGNGVFHVVATAQADATKSAIATASVLKAGFTSAGSLSSARLAHTATLLPNGRVLIAGGGSGSDFYDGLFVVEGAELFDPVTGLSSSAGAVSRDFHTATLLLDGNVLLAGGETGSSAIITGTAELEKAGSGLFEPTGSLAAARESHAATLLSDGRVLVTGGLTLVGTDSQPSRSAELYDPRSGMFLKAADMNVTRVCHTATLLADGRVLITGGGFSNPTTTNTAELFDPLTGLFTATGSMTAARAFHTATLLPNGKVLIAGGRSDSAEGAELYDPVTGLFTSIGNMAMTRNRHTATLLLDGTVLIAGGLTMVDGIVNETATTEIYDPSNGSFTLGATMRQGRFWHTATLLPGGAVLFVGGATTSDGDRITVLTSAEIYN
jgi:hypothetical protein